MIVTPPLIVRFLSPASQKKVILAAGKPFFALFKLSITFYFKCYLHHNCSGNLNWNNTQFYSYPNPLHNVPGFVFWFVYFCFLPFLRRTSCQKWKKNWFCYVRKWIGKKEMSAKKLVHRSRYTNQSCVQRSRVPYNFEMVYYPQHKISIVLWLSHLWNIFRLLDDSDTLHFHIIFISIIILLLL